jgi:uncharacterized membrane protein (UPF0127 family)
MRMTGQPPAADRTNRTHSFSRRPRPGITRKIASVLIVAVIIVAVLSVALLDSGAIINGRTSTSTPASTTFSVVGSTTTVATTDTAITASGPSTTVTGSVLEQTSVSSSSSSGSVTIGTSSTTLGSGPLTATATTTTTTTVDADNLSGFQVESLRIVTADNSTVSAGLVYIASTDSQQAQGFMNETSFGTCNGLAEGSNGTGNGSGSQCIGMIFVFSEQQDLCFWMHDTPLPLQQDWVGANGTVVYVYQAQPEDDSSVCHDAEFVLETSPSNPIVVGDHMLQGST